MQSLGAGVLDGVRVLEMGQVLAGPFAGAILADLGATVVKLERVEGGDDARRMRVEVTPERVAAYLAHLVNGPVTRYELPGIHALNFVCERALGGGGMASLRNDPLGKGMAQILLSMPVRVPAGDF